MTIFLSANAYATNEAVAAENAFLPANATATIEEVAADKEVWADIAKKLLAKKKDNKVNTEPDSRPNNNPPIVDLVKKDLQIRADHGRLKYGTFLQAFNDRNALQDAYEEALDQTCYLKQAIEEQKFMASEKPVIIVLSDAYNALVKLEQHCPNCFNPENPRWRHRTGCDLITDIERIQESIRRVMIRIK